MSKWKKTLLGLAAVGGAVAAGALYFTKKNACKECDECDIEFEDEDFDLDSDLKPVDREYVSLTPASNEEVVEEAPAEEPVAEEITEEAAEEAE